MTEQTNKITVICGANTQHPEGFVGRRVSDVRREFAQTLNIDPQALPYINGKRARDSHIIRKGGTKVEFIKNSGVKG